MDSGQEREDRCGQVSGLTVLTRVNSVDQRHLVDFEANLALGLDENRSKNNAHKHKWHASHARL